MSLNDFSEPIDREIDAELSVPRTWSWIVHDVGPEQRLEDVLNQFDGYGTEIFQIMQIGLVTRIIARRSFGGRNG